VSQRCHSCLKSYHKIFCSPEWGSFSPPTRKKSIAFRTDDRWGHAIGSRCPVHHPGCIAFDQYRESSQQCAWAPASQLEVYEYCIPAAPVERFPENHGVLELWACQVADIESRKCPWRFQSKCWCWSRLNTTFKGSMRIIPCPDVNVEYAEHTLMRKTCFVCPQNSTRKEFFCELD
jgi:hypothetical protein